MTKEIFVNVGTATVNINQIAYLESSSSARTTFIYLQNKEFIRVNMGITDLRELLNKKAGQ
jgi:hypothetical protein